MAFSFRVGTNWCHDFPKLARESGFYFNMHRNRARVEWNRICSIDVDRVVRERDFLTVDENVNNVIDYSLESEYDVKILDPNFVKLFRLAQLAVEYLLYCKQYLDQSVIILKEELKSKIEENLKLKKDIATVEDQVNSFNEKLKDRDRMLETKIGDSYGEIHKCPHCTKTFISAMFVRAHISRRHPTLSEAFSTSSSAQEEYRAETEKLHNEIKTLKERLNQTERVIRNVSNKPSRNIYMNNDLRTSRYASMDPRNDDNQEFRMEEQHKKYQEEISSLKTMLFSELRNLKQSGLKEIGLYELHDNGSINMKELIRQQENEIQKLRNQVHDNVTSDLESMQGKLRRQEEYWKEKLEQLESQHRGDIESLFAQLKLTQEAANRIKWEYESKVNDLEMQSITQSKIFTAQNERLNSISLDIQDTQSQNNSDPESGSVLKYSKEKYSKNSIPKNGKKIKIPLKGFNKKSSSKISKKSDLFFADLDSLSSHESKKILKVENISAKNLYSKTPEKKNPETKSLRKMNKSSESGFVTVQDSNFASKSSLNEGNSDRNSFFEEYSEDTVDIFESSDGDEKLQQRVKDKNHLKKLHSQAMKPITKLDVDESEKTKKEKNRLDNSEENQNKLKIQSSPSESEESELSTEAECETEISVTESEEGLPSETLDENSRTNKAKSANFNNFRCENPLLLNELKNILHNNFDNELRKLGFDPEWSGIPKATYKEKLEILKHRKKLNSMKFMAYDRIQKKLLSDVSEKMFMKQQQSQKYESVKKSLLIKMMGNVKSRAMKALNIQKIYGTGMPVIQSRDSTLRASQSKQKFGLDLLPRKLNEFDIREIRKESRNNPATPKKCESQIDSSPNPTPRPSSIHLDRIISSRIQNAKELTDSTLSLKKLTHSYKSIKDFLGQVHDEFRKSKPALDMTSAKVTSTPNRNVNNIMQDSYSIATNEREMVHSSPMSPKNNKSVLKSATGSVGSLVKKKVLFDLMSSPDKNSMQTKSMGEILADYDPEKRELNDSDWNISSISDEKDRTFQKEKSKSMDNIVLKTLQSDKIAQISSKIEKQLSIKRKKPPGSIEAMFLAKSPLKSSNQRDPVYQNTFSATNSLLKSSDRLYEGRYYNIDNKIPQAAPRNSRNKDLSTSSHQVPDTQESDLDLDINELLEIE